MTQRSPGAPLSAAICGRWRRPTAHSFASPSGPVSARLRCQPREYPNETAMRVSSSSRSRQPFATSNALTAARVAAQCDRLVGGFLQIGHSFTVRRLLRSGHGRSPRWRNFCHECSCRRKAFVPNLFSCRNPVDDRSRAHGRSRRRMKPVSSCARVALTATYVTTTIRPIFRC